MTGGTSGTRGKKQKRSGTSNFSIFSRMTVGPVMTSPPGCGRKQNEMKRPNFQIPVFFFLVCLARLVMTGGTSRGTINEKMICQQF